MKSSLRAPGSPEGLTRAGPADAPTAAVLRDELDGWLRGLDVPRTRRYDIVVSVYEALANCADHAYAGRARGGAMTLRAAYDRAARAIHVCITDGGIWREPPPRRTRTRGRGLALMRALADQCTIEGRAHGTTVRLHYGTAVATG